MAHIFVATPCYGGLVGHRYLHGVVSTLIAAMPRQIGITIETLAGESLISRGRNLLVAKFLAHPAATHLLFVDADIGFAPEHVFRLLDFDVDVAAASYPLKTMEWDEAAVARARAGELVSTAPLRYVGRALEGEAAGRRGGFVRAEYVGTGFLLIRRAVFARLREGFPELWYEAPHGGDRSVAGPYHAAFDCMIDPETRQYLAEDYGFCRRWRGIGGEIWLDVESVLSHTGAFEFVGAPAVRFGAA